jgi:tryptophan-rich sensory protein
MKIFKLILSVVICLGAGAIGSLFTASSIPTWYTTIEKPFFNPPNWIFGPVWTLLFIMMGVALFLVWNKGWQNKKVKIAMLIFGIQFLLNILWSILFFGFLSPFYAFVEIIFLWLAILVTIIYFYQISRPASWLLVPYILWVSFASVLNFFIWRLNI